MNFSDDISFAETLNSFNMATSNIITIIGVFGDINNSEIKIKLLTFIKKNNKSEFETKISISGMT